MMEFISNCINWPRRHVGELCDMQERAKDISRATFQKRIGGENLRELERSLGYAENKRRGLTMANDYHVNYRRSSLYGVRVYYLVWSGIEYVFGPSQFDLDRAEART